MHVSPGHPVSVPTHPGRVTVRLDGEVFADSRWALCLREAGYEPVLHLPRADVRDSALVPSARTGCCPYEGAVGGRRSAHAAWSYLQPSEAVADIAGHLAFSAERVDAIEVR